MTLEECEVFSQALNIYGPKAQMIMVMEEMSELQKELCKNLRESDNRNEICEEIADVGIMLDQMKLLFECEKEVDNARAFKVERLKKRLEKLKK